MRVTNYFDNHKLINYAIPKLLMQRYFDILAAYYMQQFFYNSCSLRRLDFKYMYPFFGKSFCNVRNQHLYTERKA